MDISGFAENIVKERNQDDEGGSVVYVYIISKEMV